VKRTILANRHARDSRPSVDGSPNTWAVHVFAAELFQRGSDSSTLPIQNLENRRVNRVRRRSNPRAPIRDWCSPLKSILRSTDPRRTWENLATSLTGETIVPQTKIHRKEAREKERELRGDFGKSGMVDPGVSRIKGAEQDRKRGVKVWSKGIRRSVQRKSTRE